MTDTHVNLGIIGSGSGNSLITPFWDDQRVMIAERGVFGGTCLNVGCIPTKMFVRPASLARIPEEAARLGVEQRTVSVDWPAIRDRVFGRIDPISEGGERYRRDELDNVELVSETVVLDGPVSTSGPKPFGDPKLLRTEDGSRISCEQLVIAAGSRAVLPDIPGIDLPGVHTSDTIMRLDELPARVLVLGGGYIACEFAGVFSGLGSEVVQLNRGPRLLSRSDQEISEAFTEVAAQRWDVRLNTTVASFSPAPGGGIIAELTGTRTGAGTGAGARAANGAAEASDGADGARERIEADVVLVAVGRRPNSDLVGAAEAGIDLLPDGRIAVDEYQRVLAGGAPVPGLYALGDVCSEAQLKHVANHEARVVAHNLEHPEDLRAARHEAIPGAVFSDPEVAQVGLTEAEAIALIGAENVTAKTQRYGDTAYGWAMEDEFGLFKVVADRRDGQILGAHVLGYQASNLIQVVIMAMSFGIDAYTAARGQYWIHPALMEVAENALLGLDVPLPEHPAL